MNTSICCNDGDGLIVVTCEKPLKISNKHYCALAMNEREATFVRVSVGTGLINRLSFICF